MKNTFDLDEALEAIKTPVSVSKAQVEVFLHTMHNPKQTYSGYKC